MALKKSTLNSGDIWRINALIRTSVVRILHVYLKKEAVFILMYEMK